MTTGSAQDRWYGPAVAAGLVDPVTAGWIDEPDGATGEGWWTAPLDMSGWVWRPGHNTILVTTGAFDPFHVGHLDMMATARQCAVSNGLWVAGGVVSPSHDTYVSTKRPDAANGPARVAAARSALATAEQRWLTVDDAEALVARAAVNFTTVCDRVLTVAERAAPVGCSVRVRYVFGSDNAGFAGAFLGPPAGCGAIMVQRGGHLAPARQTQNVLCTSAATRAVSSTGIRAGLVAA